MLLIFGGIYLLLLLMIVFGCCDAIKPKARNQKEPPVQEENEDKLVRAERERIA